MLCVVVIFNYSTLVLLMACLQWCPLPIYRCLCGDYGCWFSFIYISFLVQGVAGASADSGLVLGADAGAKAVFEQGSSSGQDGGHMLLDADNFLVRYVCVCLCLYLYFYL